MMKKSELTAKTANLDPRALATASDETTAQLQGYLFSVRPPPFFIIYTHLMIFSV